MLNMAQLCPRPIPTSWSVPPESLYYEVASRAKTAPRPVPPVMSLGPSPSQVGAKKGCGGPRELWGTWVTHASSLPSLSVGAGPQQSPEG